MRPGAKTASPAADKAPQTQLLSVVSGRLTPVFIAFEGGDGAGKSLQADLLARRLRFEGVAGVAGAPDLVVTREPGGTALGSAIRQLLLHGQDVAAVTEALLYAADRAQHVAQVIKPALRAGGVVITDRYVDSSLAYQAAGRGLGVEAVKLVNDLATGGLVPDITLLLDLPAEQAAGRRAATGQAPDRLERAGDRFHQAVAEGYLALAAEAPDRYAVIDASGTPDQVAELVWAAVSRRAGW